MILNFLNIVRSEIFKPTESEIQNISVPEPSQISKEGTFRLKDKKFDEGQQLKSLIKLENLMGKSNEEGKSSIRSTTEPYITEVYVGNERKKVLVEVKTVTILSPVNGKDKLNTSDVKSLNLSGNVEKVDKNEMDSQTVTDSDSSESKTDIKSTSDEKDLKNVMPTPEEDSSNATNPIIIKKLNETTMDKKSAALTKTNETDGQDKENDEEDKKRIDENNKVFKKNKTKLEEKKENNKKDSSEAKKKLNDSYSKRIEKAEGDRKKKLKEELKKKENNLSDKLKEENKKVDSLIIKLEYDNKILNAKTEEDKEKIRKEYVKVKLDKVKSDIDEKTNEKVKKMEEILKARNQKIKEKINKEEDKQAKELLKLKGKFIEDCGNLDIKRVKAKVPEKNVIFKEKKERIQKFKEDREKLIIDQKKKFIEDRFQKRIDNAESEDEKKSLKDEKEKKINEAEKAKKSIDQESKEQKDKDGDKDKGRDKDKNDTKEQENETSIFKTSSEFPFIRIQMPNSPSSTKELKTESTTKPPVIKESDEEKEDEKKKTVKENKDQLSFPKKLEYVQTTKTAVQPEQQKTFESKDLHESKDRSKSPSFGDILGILREIPRTNNSDSESTSSDKKEEEMGKGRDTNKGLYVEANIKFPREKSIGEQEFKINGFMNLNN